MCYTNGEGVEQNYTEAVKWYRKAAEQGDAWAQCELGLLYEYGNGVERSYTEATKWYRKAAELYRKDAKQGEFSLRRIATFTSYSAPLISF